MKPYLRIEKSCEELLENMHDVPEGKFCDLCSKQVYDLTTLSRSEILNIIEQNNGQKFCGILINREPQKPVENKIHFPEKALSKNMVFTKIAAGFALTASLINTYPAQTKNTNQTKNKTFQKNPTKETQKEEEKTENGNSVISGKVISVITGKPVTAEISLITILKVYSTKTDENGYYSLEIPKELSQQKNYLLEFNPDLYSFDRKLKVFDKQDLTKNNIMELVENNIYKELGEVSVGPPYARENSFIFLDGKKMDYKLYNKSYSLYSRQYEVHYIPQPFTKFFTSSEKVKDIYIVFVK